MIHLSSYHSNGLPTVVWTNKVNLIGEKVYKPKIHFCEHCNKPILIYGRLIPCKHVFCFTCATLCLTQQQQSNLIQAELNQDKTSSPSLNGTTGDQQLQQQNQSSDASKGCHRCGGRTLRVERNTLNSIFVCQIDTCRRTYLSARDLQAHITHRHNRNKSNNNASSASQQAISSSPYISSSSLQHLNSHNQSNNHRQSSSSNSTINNNNTTNSNNHNSPNNHHLNRSDREHHHHHHHGSGSRDRDRDRDRERDRHNRDRESYQRERERERDSKEYHRQSLQRAAQWAEASAQLLEKGLTR